MATMIPSTVHDDCKSSAERRLFSRLKNELPDSYTVFHSLGMSFLTHHDLRETYDAMV